MFGKREASIDGFVPGCFHPGGGVKSCGIGVAGADAVGAGAGEAAGTVLAVVLGNGEATAVTSAIGTRDTVKPICASNAGTP